MGTRDRKIKKRRDSRPLYARVLRLKHIRPGSVLCFVFFELTIFVAAVLGFAELISWWMVPVLPVVVAVMVKLNDVIAGAAAGTPPASPERSDDDELADYGSSEPDEAEPVGYADDETVVLGDPSESDTLRAEAEKTEVRSRAPELPRRLPPQFESVPTEPATHAVADATAEGAEEAMAGPPEATAAEATEEANQATVADSAEVTAAEAPEEVATEAVEDTAEEARDDAAETATEEPAGDLTREPAGQEAEEVGAHTAEADSGDMEGASEETSPDLAVPVNLVTPPAPRSGTPPNGTAVPVRPDRDGDAPDPDAAREPTGTRLRRG
ncbi:MAG: hypothetical protein ACRDTM_05915 [Micromonosporaceae bacterium]